MRHRLERRSRRVRDQPRRPFAQRKPVPVRRIRLGRQAPGQPLVRRYTRQVRIVAIQPFQDRRHGRPAHALIALVLDVMPQERVDVERRRPWPHAGLDEQRVHGLQFLPQHGAMDGFGRRVGQGHRDAAVDVPVQGKHGFGRRARMHGHFERLLGGRRAGLDHPPQRVHAMLAVNQSWNLTRHERDRDEPRQHDLTRHSKRRQ